MYNLTKNNYHQKPKNSVIYTPSEVSQFIFKLLKDKIPQDNIIFDPCSGLGSLLAPWKENSYQTFGNDINPELLQQGLTNSNYDFLNDFKIKWTSVYAVYPKLILCNPPFNGYKGKLAPEIWLDKIIELFGRDIPLVLFAPIGFRMNLTLESKRHQKFTNGTYPAISSLITLPKNIFPGVTFHSEILIFNIPNLEAHYFFNYESH
jgi:N-6 DNA Methylase